MNRNEVEQWMKECLGNQEFTPSKEGWDRLQTDLNPAARKRVKKPLIPAFSARIKAAASVVLLLMAGMAVCLIQHDSDTVKEGIIQNRENTQITFPIANKEKAALKTEAIRSAAPLSPEPVVSAAPVSSLDDQSAHLISDSPHSSYIPAASSQRKEPGPAPESRAVTLPERPFDNTPGIEMRPILKDQETHHGLKLGVAAQFGTVSIGNMQYQVGVVAHKNISARFYAGATLALAATDVAYTQQNNFRSVAVNSAIGASIEEKTVEARYGQHIISVGVLPNIGYRITPRLALSCGLALYHNLDQTLNLINEETITPAAISNHIISDKKPINKWDAGFTGSATYHVSRKLAVDIQYRYGLSAYMYFNDRPVRNSGLSLGLNYMFGRDRTDTVSK